MKSFDEWINENGFNFRPEQYDLYKYLYEAGQQSKQAEVDELQLKLSEDSRVLHNVIDIERKKCEELQKRVDDLKYFCIKGVESNMLSIEYNQALIDMHKILKGDTNDH